MTDEVINKACLGRPFHLGMLYDCRTDQLLPGISLWDFTAIKEATETRSLSDTGYEVITAQSLGERASHFGVDSSLQFSLLTGLVNALGATSYLGDFTSSENHACVCLKHWNMSKYEYFEMDQLGKIANSAYGKLATHIVIQIVYGLEVIIKFNQPLDKDGNLEESQKILLNTVKLIALNENLDSCNSEIDKCFCTCYCDVYPIKTLTSAWDAIESYYKLVQNTNQEMGIQKRALLFPLAKLCINAPKYNQTIPASLSSRVEGMITIYVNIQIQIEKLLINNMCLLIPGFKSQLHTLKDMVENYKALLKNKLATLLPYVREGKVSLTKLQDVIDNVDLSPFNPQRLVQWINSKKTELKELDSIVMHLKHLHVVNTVEELQTLSTSALYCFCLSFVQLDNSYLDSMFKYIYLQEKVESNSSSLAPLSWFEDSTLLLKLKTASVNFKEFFAENLNKSGVKFALMLSDQILTKSQDAPNDEFTWLCKNGVAEHFVPPSTPGVPMKTNRSYDSITLEWSEPEYGIQSLTHYTVQYKRESEKVWKEKHTEGAKSALYLNDLESDTVYYLRIMANFTNDTSLGNKNSVRIKTAELPLAHRTKKNSNFIKKGPPAIYQLEMKENHKDYAGMVSWQSFGNPPAIATKKKVLIVVGATGAGKTTLINGMINYMFKVDWNDDFRFKLVDEIESKETQAKSQTAWINVYTFYKVADSPVDYTLICKMFTSKGPYSIDQLDGIEFVVHASGAHLHQQYIYDSILTIFGKDVSENIFIMTTFSDGLQPPVLDAIKSAKIPYNTHFKFNNSALFVHSDSTVGITGNFDKMFWDMNYNSFELFFKSFNKRKNNELNKASIN